MSETVAFVGAAGGVGTTRLTVEIGRVLASEGIDTAILDAAYGTQGLSDRVAGRLDPDMTALCLDESPLEEGLVDLSIEGSGRLSVCPARAPFERLARAKTPDAAERLEERVEEATRHFNRVLLDTPPIATNPAVAAVKSAGTVAIVCDDRRAESAVPRTEDRLADIGSDPSATLVTRAETHPDADIAIPTFEAGRPATNHDSPAHAALAKTAEVVADVSIERTGSEGLLERVPFR